MTHRFASHCCESLFVYAAPFVTAELLYPNAPANKPDESNPDEVYVSMENLFLHTLAELDGNLPFMMTDRYASHTLRTLLLVLAGEPVSKKMEGKRGRSHKPAEALSFLNLKDEAPEVTEEAPKTRSVPESFSTALEKTISGSIAGFDTPKLRALATHPIASPTLQVLLRIEMTHYGKARAKDVNSIMHTLLPDDPFTAECESAAFLSGLVYDTVGVHLVEAIIRWAPAKLFKKLYHTMFKERLAAYARNEIATYIDCRILERLGYDDLMDAHEIIAPLVPMLCERKWTALTRTLIERCTARKIDTQAIAVQLEEAFQGSDGNFDVYRMLFIDAENASQSISQSAIPDEPSKAVTTTSKETPTGVIPAAQTPNPVHDPAAAAFSQPVQGAQMHFNLLAQAMLIVPGSLSALIIDSLIMAPPPLLIRMAHDPIVTRTLQQALTTANASIIQRRKLIQPFYGTIGAMALDKAASHVVDCIWVGTHGLAFIRERIAEELAENEASLRASPCGRAVWKNWKMDVYQRRRPAWVRYSKIKASNDGFQSFSELDQQTTTTTDSARATPAHVSSSSVAGTPTANGAVGEIGVFKTPLQMARERHAKGKAKERAQKEQQPHLARSPAPDDDAAPSSSRPQSGASSSSKRRKTSAAPASGANATAPTKREGSTRSGGAVKAI
jgi:nucleolar protein 9